MQDLNTDKLTFFRKSSTAPSTLNSPSFRNKDGHPDPTRRNSEWFYKNPTRNKNLYQRIILQLILMCSIISQPVIDTQQQLVVFEELGLLFNPSHINEAWWENNTILDKSVSAYMTSEH
jgi:hypothetical protein